MKEDDEFMEVFCDDTPYGLYVAVFVAAITAALSLLFMVFK